MLGLILGSIAEQGFVQAWTIGAAVTFSAIRRSRRLRATHPILADAASQIGGWQIQNRATLGGNMANASPAGDSLPVLLAAMVLVAAPLLFGWLLYLPPLAAVGVLGVLTSLLLSLSSTT